MQQWPKCSDEGAERIGRNLHRRGNVLKGGDEHSVAQTTLRGVADCVDQAVETSESVLHLIHRRGDLSGVSDVEFDYFTDVAELARRAPRQRRAPTRSCQRDGRALFQGPPGDAKCQ